VNPPATGVDEGDGHEVFTSNLATVHTKVGALAVLSSAIAAVVNGVGLTTGGASRNGVGIFAGLGDQLALGEVEIPASLGPGDDLLGEDRLRGAGFWIAYSRSMAQAILFCSATCCRLSAVGAVTEPSLRSGAGGRIPRPSLQ
jgi:hypothetical protein